MNPLPRVTGAVLSLAALAACNTSTTSGTDSIPSTTPSGATYASFASNTGGPSALAGAAVRTAQGTQARDVTATTGTLTNTTRAITVNDGTLDFNSPAPNLAGAYTSGTARFQESTFPTDTADYAFVIAYEQTYEDSGETFESFGYIGVVTGTPDMPVSGTATYRGDATVVIDAQSLVRLEEGDSTVIVDFGLGSVDVTMNDFDRRTGAAPGSTAARIDTVSVTGMAIDPTDRNTFSGGAMTTFANGNAVSAIGVGVVTEAAGAFYGFDLPAQRPDELAGAVASTGSGGTLSGFFIAD